MYVYTTNYWLNYINKNIHVWLVPDNSDKSTSNEDSRSRDMARDYT